MEQAETVGANLHINFVAVEVVRQLKVSKKKTETMFDELYRRLSLLARQPVADLFDQLERFFLSETDQSEASDVRYRPLSIWKFPKFLFLTALLMVRTDRFINYHDKIQLEYE